ncbi:RNA-splicing ligase RtcB [Xenorhabdus budapestensis]|uniref:RNA-splicing ligase RtcB n=1 Tax=Xenorhabdus budapestensis TaxID=290110 RepID=A0A2D0J3S9_XENBU|nr:RtcB family protein [Xenorhabdus budapestensis]PHM29023.1 RNA-splicing ligase RtcB [Xenorhabdus budapestensis]
MKLHRKGATPARAGELALIPGSMGTSGADSISSKDQTVDHI